MQTVETSLPDLDVRSWKSSPEQASLLLPQLGACSTVLLDNVDGGCWLVTGVEEREGKRYRSSAECNLAPDLLVEYGSIREDEETNGVWQRVEGRAAPIPTTNYGLLTSVSDDRLEYGGERVDPTEVCTGVDLLGCPNTVLPPGHGCRSCDRSALFFEPRPAVLARRALPVCLTECPTPPHEQLLAAIGDLGLWRARPAGKARPQLFRSASACVARLGISAVNESSVGASATSRTRNRD